VAVISHGSIYGSSAAVSVVVVFAVKSSGDRQLQLDGLETTNG
jgi:mevalonate kinase